MSTHGLEYGELKPFIPLQTQEVDRLIPNPSKSGFPSSHSANSVSIALFLETWLSRKFAAGEVDASTLSIGRAGV